MCPTDSGVSDGTYIQFSDTQNHMTEWHKVVHDNVPEREASQIIGKGYKSIPRGRVIYDLRTQSYIITCGSQFKDDVEFKSAICSAFEIPAGRTDLSFIDTHYHVYEYTGNKFLDDAEYGV